MVNTNNNEYKIKIKPKELTLDKFKFKYKEIFNCKIIMFLNKFDVPKGNVGKCCM